MYYQVRSRAQLFSADLTDIPLQLPLALLKIGKTTYRVTIHFSATSRETMSDKIKRMLRNEIRQM
ncbi:MAG: transposon-encoded TnpW family protein [Oscillospiraceae bacterium]|nr:transposon-encoded TnpW family protein [Oscillospiraceae bacterium]